ncbi:DUF4366 domain-containing protein [Bacillus cytotoxicus]|uniref:DUF4366 domain-containing protein n=1 Tax=Bacillus cytotoxicus TaxID=580165 RepID=A0ACC6A6F0_9BACI|nr:DUF4366 domain-containing protein [Bacillus cytotoxicus]
MLKIAKHLFLITLLMFSMLFMSVSNFAYAEEKKSETEKTTDKKVGEPASGPDVQGEKKEKEVEVGTPASVNGKKVQGTGTVTDFTTSGSKAFYTIHDKDNNVFYLIVDLDKTDNNVYFLSDVKKSAMDGTAGKTDGTAKPNVPNQKQAETEKTAANTKTTSEKPKEEGSNNSFLLIVLVIAVIGTALYYFLVIKKKKNKTNTNEDEEVMEDNYYEDNLEDETNKNNKKD